MWTLISRNRSNVALPIIKIKINKRVLGRCRIPTGSFVYRTTILLSFFPSIEQSRPSYACFCRETNNYTGGRHMINCSRPVVLILQYTVYLWCRITLKLKVHGRDGEFLINGRLMSVLDKPIDRNFLLFSGVGDSQKLECCFLYTRNRANLG